MKNIFCTLSLVASLAAYAQVDHMSRIRSYRAAHEQAIVREFVSFLALPNIAADLPAIRRNAETLMDMMKRREISDVQLLTPSGMDAPPVVYGEVKVPGATRTVVYYAHYDGQPVDSTQWLPGLHPFRPALASGPLDKNGRLMAFPKSDTARYDGDWRIYARGASDDKAGVMSILNAWDAIRAQGLKPGTHIKFFFEGEEEAGSGHLKDILIKYRDLLKADLWIFCDGPVHQSGRQQVVFGVRGDTHLELTVFASKRPLHSGHYGNWAPNPAMLLSKLLASMKDERGRVTVKGFYDDVIPLSASENRALQSVPAPDEQLKNELGFIQPDMEGLSLSEAILQPSLNINGITSAGTGKYSSNVIPTRAVASIDLRLVPGNDWIRQQDKVIAHIREQGFYVTENEPTDEERMRYPKLVMVKRSDGYNAQRTNLDLPLSMAVIDALKKSGHAELVIMPSLGGSLPLFLFEKYLSASVITVPIANHDNNQHAENENIRISNFFRGMETHAALMLMKF